VGRHGDAVVYFRRATGVSPENPEIVYNLSNSLGAIGDLAGAEGALREAIRIRADFVEAHTNLGAVLTRMEKLDEAVACFQEAARIRRADPLARLNLGKALRSLDRLDEAEAAFREAIGLAPNLAPAWNMLGSCLREAGRVGEAVSAFERATQLDPQSREAHSNLCYALYFDPAASGERIVETHRDWGRKFAAVATPRDYGDRSNVGRLRIGYVSPNFRSHAVGSFVLPIFENHYPEEFNVVAYSDTTHPDGVTKRLRQCTSLWRETRGLDDRALAELIREDGIDILVDLTLHMRGCRLGVFANRPAPVQLTHLAYCGTSGLAQMDGCVTDVHMLTDGARAFFTETLLPLPQSYWAYHPPTGIPEVGPLPAERNGHVTFGSFNSLAKVNNRVLGVWARILEAVPDSRLALFVPGFEFNPSVFRRLESCGIPRKRVDAYARRSLEEYFRTYSHVDVALDPFPYNGGTTSLDALWMGVPVVTLAGKLPVGRAGVSILKNLGLEEFVAAGEEEYVNTAVKICSDPENLAALRGQLRARVLSSALLDIPAYVRGLEALYREAWEAWLMREVAP
jgi:protein O-GlcNAc transferase